MKYTQRIITSIVISTFLLSVIFTEYYWPIISDFGVLVGGLLILIFGLTLIIKLISTGISVYRSRHNLTVKLLLPTLIYIITVAIIYIDPEFLNRSSYESKMIYQGCYEGTVNTGVIYFRESGKFEYRHGGAFGFTTYRDGTWQQSGDTLLIKYTNNKVHQFVGEKLLMTEDRFIKVHADTLQDNRWGFYRGLCKGLN